MISFATLISAIAVADDYAPVLLAGGEKLVGLVRDQVVAAENAFGSVEGTGASKLNMVMAAVKAYLASPTVAKDEAEFVPTIEAVIRDAKAAWNAIVAAQPATHAAS